jgi:hypothetical protein
MKERAKFDPLLRVILWPVPPWVEEVLIPRKRLADLVARNRILRLSVFD